MCVGAAEANVHVVFPGAGEMCDVSYVMFWESATTCFEHAWNCGGCTHSTSRGGVSAEYSLEPGVSDKLWRWHDLCNVVQVDAGCSQGTNAVTCQHNRAVARVLRQHMVLTCLHRGREQLNSMNHMLPLRLRSTRMIPVCL